MRQVFSFDMAEEKIEVEGYSRTFQLATPIRKVHPGFTQDHLTGGTNGSHSDVQVG